MSIASLSDGLYFPFSKCTIVSLLAFTSSANSACFMPAFSRYSFIFVTSTALNPLCIHPAEKDCSDNGHQHKHAHQHISNHFYWILHLLLFQCFTNKMRLYPAFGNQNGLLMKERTQIFCNIIYIVFKSFSRYRFLIRSCLLLLVSVHLHIFIFVLQG